MKEKYNEGNLNKQMRKVDVIVTKLWSSSKKNISDLLTLPNIEVARKKWHILQISPEFHNVFVDKPTIAFKRNENIQDLIGWNLIKNRKVAKKKLEIRKVKERHIIKQDHPCVVCKW